VVLAAIIYLATPLAWFHTLAHTMLRAKTTASIASFFYVYIVVVEE
jgi:hypothetical protein